MKRKSYRGSSTSCDNRGNDDAGRGGVKRMR